MKTFAAVALVLGLLAAPAFGQAPPSPPPAPQAPLVNPNPTYVSAVMEVTVNRPAAQVWARIGDFCDIGEWLGRKCEITAGTDNELGAVRTLDGVVVEILVSKTPLSYTYAQPVRQGTPYILYHGTLEARPVSATSSKLVYSLMWDNSTLADDLAREKDIATRKTRFGGALETMKKIVESGKPRS
jgi:hypothetical protein